MGRPHGLPRPRRAPLPFSGSFRHLPVVWGCGVGAVCPEGRSGFSSCPVTGPPQRGAPRVTPCFPSGRLRGGKTGRLSGFLCWHRGPVSPGRARSALGDLLTSLSRRPGDTGRPHMRCRVWCLCSRRRLGTELAPCFFPTFLLGNMPGEAMAGAGWPVSSRRWKLRADSGAFGREGPHSGRGHAQGRGPGPTRPGRRAVSPDCRKLRQGGDATAVPLLSLRETRTAV